MGQEVYVLGAGGHAKVVIATLRAAGHRVAAGFDDRSELRGESVCGVDIEGSLARLREVEPRPCIVAVGSNPVRQAIVGRFPSAEWMTAIHPAAVVDQSVTLGPGTVVFAGAIIQPGAVIGAHAIINTGATVDHDCNIGDYVHLAPGCHLAGNVTLEEGVFAGLGVNIIPGITVGAWTQIGAGATVIHDLPARITAVGVPAKELRTAGTD